MTATRLLGCRSSMPMPWAATARGSTKQASLADTFAGRGTMARSGTRISSAIPPSRPTPIMLPGPRRHSWYSPLTHISQCPQGANGSSATSRPSRSTPATSCPSVPGMGNPALIMCRSELQMPADRTFTFTPSPTGAGTSTTSTCLLQQRTARMALPLAQAEHNGRDKTEWQARSGAGEVALQPLWIVQSLHRCDRPF